ncbi:MAG: Gfo/Idh/MocA family oxidoreductase [Myxococcaceae bacterium]|nr:Gfo/Idh/MocA family oxidoreductase [Myxococcaceae bacterium]
MRRVALLGFGAMGRLHARTLLSSPTFCITGVFDPDDAVHVGSAIPRCATEELAIAGADLVVVATPIAEHAGAAIRGLAAGCDVFVEKPMGATFRDAAAMVDAARHAGQRLFVGHSERFNPVVRAIAGGVVPASIRRIGLRRVGPPRRARAHDPVLLNLGVHDLDLVAHLTGSTFTVCSAHGGDEAADVVLVTASGCDAMISVARTTGARDRRIVVETGDEIWRGDLLALELEVTSLVTGLTRTIPIDAVEPLVAQAHALAAALGGSEPGPSPVATGIDGARAVLGVEAAEAFLRSRGSVVAVSPSERASERAPERPAENL